MGIILGQKELWSTVKIKENGIWQDFYVVDQSPGTILMRASCIKKMWFTFYASSGTYNDYRGSRIDNYFENDYFSTLDPYIQKNILTTTLKYARKSTSWPSTIDRKIFAPSRGELLYYEDDSGDGPQFDAVKLGSVPVVYPRFYTRTYQMDEENPKRYVYIAETDNHKMNFDIYGYADVSSYGNDDSTAKYYVLPCFRLPSSILVSNDGTIQENQPPTTPTSITFGTPKAGESITVTSTASSDPNGDSITYVFERQVDSGSWTPISATYNKSITDRVPGSGTYINYRVKARDTAGAESSYRVGTKQKINYPIQITVPGIPFYKYPISGKTVRIEWRESATQDSSPITYVVETKIGSGNWTEQTRTSDTYYIFTIPSVTENGSTLTVRVKAIATDGNESGYSTGKATEILYHKVIRFIPWNFGTDFRIRQFTKNSRSQYQTMLTGSTAEIVATGNLRLGDMPVGTLVRFGSIYNESIVWKIADKNHEGYPDNSATLITNQVIKVIAADAAEKTNPDDKRQVTGNNRYIYSNIRQWMNSDKLSNQWYTAQHTYDAPPSQENLYQRMNPYDSEAGFLNGFTEQEKSIILDTTIQVAKAIVDGSGIETVKDKIFLASCTEMGLSGDQVVGSKLSAFSGPSSVIATATESCVSHSDFVSSGLKVGSPWYYFLRDPVANTSNEYYYPNTLGILTSGTAWSGAHGFRPLCNISADTMLDPNPNPDGSYNIVWE